MLEWLALPTHDPRPNLHRIYIVAMDGSWCIVTHVSTSLRVVDKLASVTPRNGNNVNQSDVLAPLDTLKRGYKNEATDDSVTRHLFQSA